MDRFLCDRMLLGLGRWLRIAGYDAADAREGEGDRALVARAGLEDRLLLTCDRKLLELRHARERALLLPDNRLLPCAARLAREAGVDWRRAPLSRCTICNVPVEDVPREDVAGALPPGVARRLDARPDRGAVLARCPRCGRVYWPGLHVDRMLARLDALARAAAGGGVG